MIRHATSTGVKNSRRYLSLLGNLLLWAVILVDAWFLWPTALGGATSLVIVSGNSMFPTYEDGDLVVARVGEPSVGDVVVYSPEMLGGARVVHRIVGGNADDGWEIQGDANSYADQWRPGNDEIVGVVELHYARVGLFATLLMTPWTWGFVLLAAVGLILWPDDHDDEDGAAPVAARQEGAPLASVSPRT